MSAHPAQALWEAERGELQGMLSTIYWTLRDAVYQPGGAIKPEQVAAMIEAIEVMDHRIMQRRDGA